jgi:WD40 repeat protein
MKDMLEKLLASLTSFDMAFLCFFAVISWALAEHPNNATSGRILQILKGHTGGVESVAFSKDGRRIASGSDDRSVKIWDAGTGKCLQTLTGHSAAVNSVAFSPDGSHVASGSLDKSVTIWDTSGLAKPHLGNSSFQANQRKMFI